MAQVMERSDILVASVLNVCKLRDAWLESGVPRISNDFAEAMDELTAVFDEGDIPAECRVLFNVYPVLREEWKQFEEYASERNPAPRQAFFAALGNMEKYLLDHEDDWEAPPMEPLKDLMEQKVPFRQICIIYSHKGKGPFMRKGVPQPHLVKRELDKPGSVLNGDWVNEEGTFVHPAVKERLEAGKRVEKRLIKRAAKLLGESHTNGAAATEAPEFVPPTMAELDALEEGGVVHQVPEGIGGEDDGELTDAERDITQEAVDKGEEAIITARVHQMINASPNVSNRDIADSLGITIAEAKKARSRKPQ